MKKDGKVVDFYYDKNGEELTSKPPGGPGTNDLRIKKLCDSLDAIMDKVRKSGLTLCYVMNGITVYECTTNGEFVTFTGYEIA
jgi:hypothetical protein